MTITEPHTPTADELLDLWHDMVTPADVRMTDPPTSHEARDSISEDSINLLQRNILALFAYGPMADYRLIEKYNINVHVSGWPHATDQSIRSRRAELVKKGYLVASIDSDVMPVTGRRTTKWKYAR